MCALIKTGGGISEIRGSIGGTVFSRGRYGAIARNRSIPVQPNSQRQIISRLIFGYAMELWRSMTDAQRESWNTYAAGVAMVNRIGETMYLSGQNQFLRTNTARLGFSQPEVLTAPAILNLGETDPGASVTGVSVDAANNEINTSILITEGLAPYIGATNGVGVYVSAPSNPSTYYYGGNMIKLLYIPGSTSPGLQSPLENSTTPTQTIPWQVGQQVWLGLRWFMADGRVTQLRKVGPITIDSPA